MSSGDPYRYFRVEARELADALAAGVSGLGRGAATAEVVAALLRHAHTLKGAARVVSQPAIADQAHALEDLLGPFRDSADTVPQHRIDELLALVDGISDRLRDLDGAVPEPRPSTESVAQEPVASGISAHPAEPAQPSDAGTVRVELVEVDEVIREVGQTLSQLGVLRECLTRAKALRSRPEVKGALAEELETLGRRLAGCTDRLDRELRQVHDTVERLRLMPVAAVIPDLERAARDVAAAQGKRVQVQVEDGQLRLEAPVVTTVQAGLAQIVRNAVAHGIESPRERAAAGKPMTGRIRLEASLAGDRVTFRCSDDGRGVDLDGVRRALRAKGVAGAQTASQAQLLDLLVGAGVSTASTVSEVAGRGIGLDVVRDVAQRLGGSVSMRTWPGSGTTVELTVPLSLSAQEVLVVDGGDPVGVPLRAVRETVRVEAKAITNGLDGEVYRYRGEDVPFLPLAAVLGSERRTYPAWSLLVVQGESGLAAIGVPRVIGTAGLAIRPLPERLPEIPGVCGVWFELDGRPRLLLDPESLVAAASGQRAPAPAEPEASTRILVIDDSLTTRMLEQSILESAGYLVDVAASAEEGLAMAARSAYSVALVDVEMPGMDGFGFVEQTRLRAELRQLPCILVTSRASAQDRERGRAVGARAHIDKGEFHQGTLLSRINELVAG
jgi:two-component system chemotaxis sensor kinase CheA